MDYDQIIKEIGRGKNHARDMNIDTARTLYRAILAGQVPDMELGSLLIALRIKGESEAELQGFYQAIMEQTLQLSPPAGHPLPIVIPSYNGARKQANLTPLLALVLSQLGFPVFTHVISDDPGRVTSEAIFRLAGIKPVANRADAQDALNSGKLVVMTIDNFCPPLAKQLALRWRLGVRNSAHSLAKLITPFAEQSALRLTSVSHPDYLVKVAHFFGQSGAPALFLQGSEGEAYASPLRCPAIYYLAEEMAEPCLLLTKQSAEPEQQSRLPADKSVETTVRWIEDVLERKIPIPAAIRLQIACCYVATRRVESLRQGLDQLAEAGY